VRDEEETSGFKLEVISNWNWAFAVIVIDLLIDEEVLTDNDDTTWTVGLSWDLNKHMRGFIYRS
jgi:hypothetical protein